MVTDGATYAYLGDSPRYYGITDDVSYVTLVHKPQDVCHTKFPKFGGNFFFIFAAIRERSERFLKCFISFLHIGIINVNFWHENSNKLILKYP